jgi:hypothetical protein
MQLAEILQMYANMVDSDGNVIDISQGSMAWLDSNVLAQIAVGLYYYGRYVENQTLPNLTLMTRASLEKWCKIFKLPVSANDTQSQLVQKVTDRLQTPPNGGNLQDWKEWTSGVTVASRSNSIGDLTPYTERVLKLGVGENITRPGSIDVAIRSDDAGIPLYDSGVTYTTGDYVYDPINQNFRYYTATGVHQIVLASPRLVSAVQTAGEKNRALGLWDNYYKSASYIGQNVTIYFTKPGITIGEALGYMNIIQPAFVDFSNSLKIGDPVYKADLATIVNEAGVRQFTITAPANDIIPDKNTLVCILSVQGQI